MEVHVIHVRGVQRILPLFHITEPLINSVLWKMRLLSREGRVPADQVPKTKQLERFQWKVLHTHRVNSSYLSSRGHCAAEPSRVGSLHKTAAGTKPRSKLTGEATINQHPDVCKTLVWLEACWGKEKRLCDLTPCPVVLACVVHGSTLGGRKLKTQGCVQTTTHWYNDQNVQHLGW